MVRVLRVTTAGSSLAVVVPRDVARALKIARGQLMAVGVENGRLVLAPIDESDLLRLSELRRGRVTPGRP